MIKYKILEEKINKIIVILSLLVGCNKISLLDRDKNYEEVSLNINELILAAIHNNDLYLLEKYFPKIENVNILIGDRGTFLHAASEIGNTDVVKKLLELGLDPLIKNSYGKYAHELSNNQEIISIINEYIIRKEIIIAANNKENEIIKILLSKKVDVLSLKLKNVSLLEDLSEILNWKENREIFELIISLFKKDNEKIIHIKKRILEKGVEEIKTREELNEYINMLEEVRLVDEKYKIKKVSEKSYIREAINKGYVNEFNKLLNLEKKETIALAVINEFMCNNEFFINKFLGINFNLFIKKINNKLKCEFEIENSKKQIKYKDEKGFTELMLSIKYDCIDLAKRLIKGIFDNVSDEVNVKMAIMFSYGMYFQVEETIISKKELINKKDNYGRTALMIASTRGHKEILDLLIKKGAYINDEDNYGRAALMMAAESGHKEIVELLIKKGAKINYDPNHRSNPLRLASIRGHIEIVKMLLKLGANFNYENCIDYSLLNKALEYGHIEIVKILIEEANIKNNLSNEKLLIIASGNGHKKLVKLLIKMGVDIDFKNDVGTTPLMELLLKYSNEVSKTINSDNGLKNNLDFIEMSICPYEICDYNGTLNLLIKEGVNINDKGWNDRTALISASISGYIDAVKLLIEKGANINDEDCYGYTAIIYASNSGHIDVLKLLIEKGANIDHKSHIQSMYLIRLCEENLDQEYEEKLEKHRKNTGMTALMMTSSVSFDRLGKIVEVLIDNGAYINSKDSLGWTSLMVASYFGNIEVVRLLIERGADINDEDFQGFTSLMIASGKGHTELVRLLIEKGANINHKSFNQYTPLMIASGEGHTEVVRLLIEKGVDINLKNHSGISALMIAIFNKCKDIIEILISNGADVSDKDFIDFINLITMEKGYEEIGETILKMK